MPTYHRHCLWALASLCAVAFASSTSAEENAPTELLAEYNFENIPDFVPNWGAGYDHTYKPATGWKTPFTVKLDRENPHAGSNALRFQLLEEAQGEKILHTPTIEIPEDFAGRKVTVRLHLRSEGIVENGAGIRILERSGKGASIGLLSGKKTLIPVPDSADWTELVAEGVLNKGTRNISLMVVMYSEQSPATIWIDDISLEIDAKPVALQFKSDAKGHIFTEASGAVRLAAPRSAEGVVTVTDESGTVVSTQTIPDASEPGQSGLSIPLGTKGYYQIDAKVKLSDGSTKEVSTTAAVVGPVPDNRLDSRLGLWTVQGDPDLVVAAGARWNRRMTSIRNLEERLLQPDGADARATAAAQPLSPFTQVGVISFGLPLWLMPPQPPKKGFGNPLTAPTDWRKLQSLMAAYVRQQGEQFPPYFEVYNEPEWHWKGSNEELVKFLATIADGVKEARPDVKVLGPGFSSIRIKDPARLDLTTANKLGLLDHLDGIVVHAYVDGSAPEGEFVQRVIDLQQFLKEIGRPDFPIHLTEFGWTSHAGTWQKPVDELTQARYATRSLTLLAALGIENATYFCLQFKAAPNPGERGFSLVRDDSTPKPAFAAYSNVARWLAGVQGLGTWLHLTPTTHLILFEKKDGSSVAVAWDTANTREMELPLPTVRREDMMGRPLEASPRLALSPSPVFLEFPKNQSPTIKMLSPLTVMRGGEPAVLPEGDAWIAPAPLSMRARTLTVPPDAPNGDYLLLTRSSQNWLGQPIRVIPPLEVLPPVLKWPAGEETPQLVTTLISHAPAAVTTRILASLDGVRDRFLDPDPVTPGERRPLAVPVSNLVPGKRYRGKFVVDSRHEGRRDELTQPLDLTLLACGRLGSNGANPDWDAIKPIDFSLWEPFGGPIAAEDCSATFQSAYGPSGLHLRIVVRDDEHLQTREPEEMWMQDAIQIAFDSDYEKTWEPNDLFGLKGHRVFEYGLGWSGDPAAKPMTWRWVSYLPDLPVATSEPRIQLHVTRNGDKTVYEALFPWAVLGLDKAPASGSAIGLSIAVTDADTGKKNRRAIRLFGGITDGKDPEKFGPLWLR